MIWVAMTGLFNSLLRYTRLVDYENSRMWQNVSIMGVEIKQSSIVASTLLQFELEQLNLLNLPVSVAALGSKPLYGDPGEFEYSWEWARYAAYLFSSALLGLVAKGRINIFQVTIHSSSIYPWIKSSSKYRYVLKLPENDSQVQGYLENEIRWYMKYWSRQRIAREWPLITPFSLAQSLFADKVPNPASKLIREVQFEAIKLGFLDEEFRFIRENEDEFTKDGDLVYEVQSLFSIAQPDLAHTLDAQVAAGIILRTKDNVMLFYGSLIKAIWALIMLPRSIKVSRNSERW
jgi:hypothetical protein